MVVHIPLGPLDTKSSQPDLRHKVLAWPGAYCLILPKKLYKNGQEQKWISEAALDLLYNFHYRVDFLFAAGCGNRTASSPGRLLVNLGGVAAPLGINPAWFALLLAILKWLALGGPKGRKMTQTWHKPPKMGQCAGMCHLTISPRCAVPLGRRLP